jgi:predicted metalloprotease
MGRPITYIKPATAIVAGDAVCDRTGRYRVRRVVKRADRIYLDFGGSKVIELRPSDAVTCLAGSGQ